MEKIIIVLLVLFLGFIAKLFIRIKRIKQNHYQKIEELKNVFKSLSNKQEVLDQKASILADFQVNYKSDMKKLSEEIFVLQKKIFELLSKK